HPRCTRPYVDARGVGGGAAAPPTQPSNPRRLRLSRTWLAAALHRPRTPGRQRRRPRLPCRVQWRLGEPDSHQLAAPNFRHLTARAEAFAAASRSRDMAAWAATAQPHMSGSNALPSDVTSVTANMNGMKIMS